MFSQQICSEENLGYLRTIFNYQYSEVLSGCVLSSGWREIWGLFNKLLAWALWHFPATLWEWWGQMQAGTKPGLSVAAHLSHQPFPAFLPARGCCTPLPWHGRFVSLAPMVTYLESWDPDSFRDTCSLQGWRKSLTQVPRQLLACFLRICGQRARILSCLIGKEPIIVSSVKYLGSGLSSWRLQAECGQS